MNKDIICFMVWRNRIHLLNRREKISDRLAGFRGEVAPCSPQEKTIESNANHLGSF
jgi:hypothetical protein